MASNKLQDAYNYKQPSNSNGIKELDEYKNLVNQKTSALSSLNQANQQAIKYAGNAALQQGYATQGANLQNIANIQNAYQAQVGGINQQYQQQLGGLQNQASKQAFEDYTTAVSNAQANNTLTQDKLNSLQDAYFGRLSQNDLTNAQVFTQDALDLANKGTPEEQQNQYNSFKQVSTTNNKEYSVDLSNDVNKNNSVLINVGNNSYELEIGKQTLSVAATGDSILKLNSKYKDKKVGEIFAHIDSNGKVVPLIKVAEGDIRVALPKKHSSQDYDMVLEELGLKK